ncbi:putative Vesicule-associated membrane protein [Leptomonas pyrrhocoris]|uniref:Putative Vesicule-associated membrane protein n=1 Tax=Leptomonas pyrrhocoris TaxID=157538 RepID=A0A0M9FXT4_LEPPY|nr:putative Vesicule-associated membrane protein [Leptomonas pyrrhocoris]KPA78310.1 putative Vesicule-associated membrane protein [Leptomonas pyrrhocoris]|eukprot:XP_015656749.1 putative Vesicule-associated membrane protein [Leptomonas pyrrhocoris]
MSSPTGATAESHALYGAVVVRLVDRVMLSKAPGVPTDGFAIPGTAWADLVSRCSAPHFRTSAFLNVIADRDPTEEVALSYHIMTDDALGYGIIGAKGVSRREGHAALDELAALFKRMFVEPAAKLNPKLVDVFARPARDLLVKQGSSSGSGGVAGDSSENKVKKVKLAVEDVKNMALDNVERVIQRGQRIDDIVQATDDLQFQAEGFQRNSRDLRNQMWWSSMQGRLMICGVAAFMLLLIYFTFFMGGKSSPTTTTAAPAPPGF